MHRIILCYLFKMNPMQFISVRRFFSLHTLYKDGNVFHEKLKILRQFNRIRGKMLHFSSELIIERL